MKKILRFVAVGMLLGILAVSNAFATVSAEGTLSYSGMSGQAAVIAMNSATWGSVDRWFVLDPQTYSSLLAVALTAMSMGKTVSVGLNSYDSGSLVTWLYIKN